MNKVLKKGRPTLYTEKLIDDFLQKIIEGSSMSQAAKFIKVDPSTIFKWLKNKPDFVDRYTEATKLRAEITYERMIDIEQGVLEGSVTPAQARVVLANQKYRLAITEPKKYTEKHSVELTGKNATIAPNLIVIFKDSENKAGTTD